jgi:hypothetical protein
MRLYEFTNPNEYPMLEAHATDVLKQTENVWTDDKANDAAFHSRKNLGTKKFKL